MNAWLCIAKVRKHLEYVLIFENCCVKLLILLHFTLFHNAKGYVVLLAMPGHMSNLFSINAIIYNANTLNISLRS